MVSSVGCFCNSHPYFSSLVSVLAAVKFNFIRHLESVNISVEDKKGDIHSNSGLNTGLVPAKLLYRFAIF